jgi:hypothetical protein
MHNSGAVLDPPLLARADSLARTFARRRLRLGITGVGASVIWSLCWLAAVAVAAPSLIAAWRQPAGPIAAAVIGGGGALFFALLHAVLVLPLEHAGGRQVVRRVPTLGSWLGGWGRGVASLVTIIAASTALIAASGTLGYATGAAATCLAMAIAVLAGQGPLARIIAPLPRRRPSAAEAARIRAAGLDPDLVQIITTPDDAFVGGWIGLGAWRELWMPEHWLTADGAPVFDVQLLRRRIQWESLARRRGWWRAAAWPATGLLVMTSILPWGWQQAHLWLALPALATLWAFLGVLVLPAMSRPAVFAADLLAARTVGRDAVARTIARLDRWQDDEPERTPLVEFIFHPVPAAGRRVRALDAARPHPLGGGHQVARLALLAGAAGGSVLGRMVHCNLGRPALWVVYPGD